MIIDICYICNGCLTLVQYRIRPDSNSGIRLASSFVFFKIGHVNMMSRSEGWVNG